MKKHRIFTTAFASVYPHYVKKAKRKGAASRSWTKSSAG